MKQTLGIQQTLKQQLTLSPQLIQTFEILAMSTLELQQRIKAEIEQNPALEIPSERVVSIERISAAEGRKRTDDDLSDTTTFPSERLGSSTRLSYTYNQEAADSNLQFLEGALSTQETLQEYLLRQLGCLSLSEEEFELGSLIISNIDYNGFHRNPVDSLVPQKRLSSLLDALAIVQKLDPPGIAAKDFRESLLLQAQDDQLLDEDELILFKALVYDHLEQLRLQKFSEVASEMKVDEHTITTLFQYLKSLNPYPGLQYDSRETHYIIPDLYVRKIEGRLQLRLNTEQVP
ncbi:MAG: RNA polymerase sigma-54 factor, partial [Sphaerochaetaceae bacterium]